MCFKMPQVQIPKVETTAKDILPSWQNKEPDSPIFGTGILDAKRKGIQSLIIGPKPVNDKATGVNPVNF